MVRWPASIALAGASCAQVLVAGCSLANGGTGQVDASVRAEGGDEIGATPSDAATDAQNAPDGPCPTVTCHGACVPTCQGCDAGTAPCLATGACGDCSSCAGLQLECFACADAGPFAFCSSPGDPCGLAPGAHCPCTFGDPGMCPGANQVCAEPGLCLSCGEDGSANITCANGLVCVGGPPSASCSGS
ncbi:MAG: hypothetical protein ACRELB_20190 [Polyangiaceae bacterium]